MSGSVHSPKPTTSVVFQLHGHKNKVVIHGERHKLVIEFGEAAGAVLVTKEPHVNHEAQDELVNRISWEVLHNEQNADCKMYFYLEQPDK